MLFFYQTVVALTPEGEPHLLLRPEVPLSIAGSKSTRTYQALVDTGADNTILPTSIAQVLGINLGEASPRKLAAYGGQELTVKPATVLLEIEDQDGEWCRWQTEVYFLETANGGEETVVLGHEGFLNFFTATFDGKVGSLELVANDTLPADDGSPA